MHLREQAHHMLTLLDHHYNGGRRCRRRWGLGSEPRLGAEPIVGINAPAIDLMEMGVRQALRTATWERAGCVSDKLGRANCPHPPPTRPRPPHACTPQRSACPAAESSQRRDGPGSSGSPSSSRSVRRARRGIRRLSVVAKAEPAAGVGAAAPATSEGTTIPPCPRKCH